MSDRDFIASQLNMSNAASGNAIAIRFFLESHGIHCDESYLGEMMTRYTRFSSIFLISVMLKDHGIHSIAFQGKAQELIDHQDPVLFQLASRQLIVGGGKAMNEPVEIAAARINLQQIPNIIEMEFVAIALDSNQALPKAISRQNCRFAQLVMYRHSSGSAVPMPEIVPAEITEINGGADYYYPDAKALRNKFGIRDQQRIEELTYTLSEKWEDSIGTIRQLDISVEAMCSIHGLLFGEIFDWAGKMRTCNIQKFGNPFADYRLLREIYEDMFRDLRESEQLVDLSRPRQIQFLAYFYSNLLTVHGFREGNGRLSRVLVNGLAGSIGLKIGFDCIPKSVLAAASREANYGFPQMLLEIMTENVVSSAN